MNESGSDFQAVPPSVLVLLGPCQIQPPLRTSDVIGRRIQLFLTEDPTLVPPDSLVVSDIDWIRGLCPERRIQLNSCATDWYTWLMLCGDEPVTERLELLRGGVHEFLERSVGASHLLDRIDDLLNAVARHPPKVMLIAEDVMAPVLRAEGMETICVRDPLRALDLLESTAPDVLLVDIEMPQCKGSELVRLIRHKERWKNIPVIYLTPHGDAEHNQAERLAAAEYVSIKPADTALLASTLRLHTEHYRRLQRVTAQRDLSYTHLEICNQSKDGVAATIKAVEEVARFAEEDLALFRRLVDASSQAIGYADALGRIRYVNPTHERLLGYTAAELQDQTFDTFFADEDKHYAAEIRAAIADGVSWHGQLPLQRADGSRLISLSYIDAIRDKHGTIQYIFNVFSDFSAEIELSTELKQALAEAEAANRAKSEFLSRMSHELRTPLNAILGFGQLIAADTTLDDDHADSVSEVLKAGRHLLALIDEVLDLSKVESGDLSLVIEPIAVADAIAECLRLVQPLARRAAITIDWQASMLGPAKVYLLGDRLRVRQVLLNLVSNAIKYNRAEGSVRIWVETLTGDTGRVRIHVEDTGAGIPAERLVELFSPFNRLGAEYTTVEGTGIGLVITRRLCRMMGGDVDLRSTPGHGSDFWIELPLAQESPVTVTAAVHHVIPPRAAQAKPERAQQVLYIEDNPANLKLMEQIFLRRPQLRLIGATSGPGGLQRARETPPDLIPLDINLPGMDGYAVLRELRRTPQTQSTPVIAVTANALPGDIEHGDAAGFTAYVTKPIDLMQFLDTLDQVLAESSLPPS